MKIKINFAELPREQLEEMDAAGAQIQEVYRLFKKASANVVGQMLAHQGTFYELDHYPTGDVYDGETYSQYYYHAHRADSGEHGHFHTFVRAKGMPDGVEPVPYDGEAERPEGKDALSHLIAISMNRPGFPIGLFTTNRWVTDETFYPADDVIAMLDRFKMDHTYPCLASNQWITSMIVLFRPQIEVLLHARDRSIEQWRKKAPGTDVYEDRDLEITSITPIDVSKQIAAVKTALQRARKVA
ncbi:MAG: DUF6969 family protein [Hyphomicrobiales bacterium]